MDADNPDHVELLITNINLLGVTLFYYTLCIFAAILAIRLCAFLRDELLLAKEFRRIANEDIDACEVELLVNEKDTGLHDEAYWQIEISRLDLKKRLSKKQKRNVRTLVVKLCESLAIESKLSQHFVDHDEDALQLALAQESAALNNLVARFERHEQEKEASKILLHLRNIAAAVQTLRTPKQARLLDRAEVWLDAFESTKNPKLTLFRRVKQ